jgi:hypothetical protein
MGRCEDIPSGVCRVRFLPSLEAFEAVEVCDSLERVPAAIVDREWWRMTYVGEVDDFMASNPSPTTGVAKEQREGRPAASFVNDDQPGGDGNSKLGERGV